MQNILQDIRYGARMLWKNRLATLVCATALALGIGANTAMFSVAEAFLLHSVPFEKPDRILAMVYARTSGMRSISRAIESRKKCKRLM